MSYWLGGLVQPITYQELNSRLLPENAGIGVSLFFWEPRAAYTTHVLSRSSLKRAFFSTFSTLQDKTRSRESTLFLKHKGILFCPPMAKKKVSAVFQGGPQKGGFTLQTWNRTRDNPVSIYITAGCHNHLDHLETL